MAEGFKSRGTGAISDDSENSMAVISLVVVMVF